jgi:hypothetical protein
MVAMKWATITLNMRARMPRVGCNQEMLPVLEAANDADGSGSYEEAQEAIRESVLCVLIRDSWREPGKPAEDGAEEYEILLSTGGPALRIWGKLGRYSEPESAELQMQDWYTLWIRYPAEETTLRGSFTLENKAGRVAAAVTPEQCGEPVQARSASPRSFLRPASSHQG